MAPQSKENLTTLNQNLLHLELKSTVLIKHLFQQLLDDLAARYSKRAMQKLKTYVTRVVDKSLHDMINADDYETFALHAQRLNNIIKQIEVKFSLEHGSNAALDEYRLLRAIRATLNDANFVNKKRIMEELLAILSIMDKQFDRFKENPHFIHWQKELTFLASQNAEEDFNAYKLKILNELLKVENEKDLANRASLFLIHQNLRSLALARHSYLEKMKSRMLKETSWFWLGVGLILVASILSLFFPYLIIVGAFVAGAVLVHATLDLTKQYRELNRAQSQTTLGSRNLHPNTESEIQAFAAELGMDVDELLLMQKQRNEKLAQENKTIERIGFALSIAGLVVGFGALALVFPMAAVPIGVAIIAVYLSVIVVCLIGILFAFKYSKEIIRIKQNTNDLEKAMERDEAIFKDHELPKPLNAQVEAMRMILGHEHKILSSEEATSTPSLFSPVLAPIKHRSIEIEDEDEGEREAEGEGEDESEGKGDKGTHPSS